MMKFEIIIPKSLYEKKLEITVYAQIIHLFSIFDMITLSIKEKLCKISYIHYNLNSKNIVFCMYNDISMILVYDSFYIT